MREISIPSIAANEVKVMRVCDPGQGTLYETGTGSMCQFAKSFHVAIITVENGNVEKAMENYKAHLKKVGM